jgi:hypothetical protein
MAKKLRRRWIQIWSYLPFLHFHEYKSVIIFAFHKSASIFKFLFSIHLSSVEINFWIFHFIKLICFFFFLIYEIWLRDFSSFIIFLMRSNHPFHCFSRQLTQNVKQQECHLEPLQCWKNWRMELMDTRWH